MNRLVLRVGLFAMVLLLPLGCQRDGMDSRPADLTLPEGFQYQVLHSPMLADSSSWVSLTVDGKGRLLASDQYGALYRVMPAPIGGDPQETQVEKLDVNVGRAQGLLWAFNSLYIVVNNSEDAEEGRRSGLYRAQDTDGDDYFDVVDSLMGFDGWGEHGPHGIILGPDSTSLYLIAGNHTEVPEVDHSLVPPVWQEDQLLPVLRDPRGHAADRAAPGGWIMRTDSTATKREIFSVGYRNAYDIAFNAEGDLFTFDSDMEWDLGMPWYRPVRVVHVTSGSEFGWRTGSGKWPAYYPDNLPGVVDVGQGSPTGVVFGGGAKFPARYRHGMFVFDWSFGTIYWVDLRPRGSTYEGVVEEFLSGIPLPVTDGVIGDDGALYFATGGRRLNSFLYRVWYEGEDAVSGAVLPRQTNVQHALRKRLEQYHDTPDPGAIDAAWPHLDHGDRFVRWAARVAIEHQPVETWAQRALDESNPIRRLYAIIALARHGGEEYRASAFEGLSGIEEETLSRAQQLDLLRAYGLLMIRIGMPEGDQALRTTEKLSKGYPGTDEAMNRERGRLLAALEAPGIAGLMLQHLATLTSRGPRETLLLTEEITERSEQYGEAITEMRDNTPGAQEIDVVLSLSNVRTGWTLSERKAYFQWFYDALRWSGGRSYVGFIEDIRSDAIEHLSQDDKEALADLVDAFSGSSSLLANLPQPVGPGRTWNRQEIWEVINEGLDEPRDHMQGEKMYAAALCSSCHRFGTIGGGGFGPDLTALGTRFGRGEIIEAIDSPSDAVSDQYASTQLTLQDGSVITGRVIGEEDGVITLSQNPYDPGQVRTIESSGVASRALSPVSIMPARLLNRLNEEEVLDLMAYLISGGDAEHKCYTGEKGCNTSDEE